MSLRASIWVLDSDIKPSLKRFVALALADAATERFKTYPTVAAICKFTGQTPATVEDNLQALIDDGIITDTSQRTGPDKSIRVFQMNCEDIKPVQATLLKPSEKKRSPEDAEAYKIYQAYHLHVAPRKALRAIAGAIKRYSFEIVMNGTKNYCAAWEASGKDKKYSPHPQGFFNDDKFVAKLEDLGLKTKKDGTPNLAPNGPTAAEFQKYTEEKFGKEVTAWTHGFFLHWHKRNWMENGKVIDWQIKVNEHVNKAKASQEKIKAQIEGRTEFPR